MAINFDNSATTKPHQEVLRSMNEVLEKYYGNPSSLHHLGVQAEQLLKKSRSLCAGLLGVAEGEIFFTSGGTESNNLAIKGTAFAYQQRGKHIITSEIEHASVYQACQALEEHFGFHVTYLPVNDQGIVSVQDVQKAITDETILVSIMHVNNEIGSVQPIEQIGQLLRHYPKTLFHVDAVQSIGKVALDIKNWNIDLLSISGHKFHAVKGSGILYRRNGVKLLPLQHGGSQQDGVRPGTENVAAFVGLAKALRLLKEDEVGKLKQQRMLQQHLMKGLEGIRGVQINSPSQEILSAPHILNVSFTGIKPEVLVHALAEKEIYVSTKSACSSKNNKVSRVLQALGLKPEIAESAVRISFSHENTLEEVEYFLQILKTLLPYYQEVMKV